MYIISYGLFFYSLALIWVFSPNTVSGSSIVDYDEVSMYNSSYSITPITVSEQNITINVNYAQDSIGNPIYCSSNSALCNLRSAFMYCNLYSDTITNTSCQIVLQSNSFLTINTTYGTMSLNSTAYIVLLGYSSIMSLNIDDSNDKLTSLITYNTNTTSNNIPIPKLYIDQVAFISFSSNGNGSILCTNNSIIVTLSNCVFANNTANNGGSIYINNTINNTVTISDCLFTNNKANTYGGAIFFESNIFSINIVSSKFYDNTATIGGGAIFLYSNTKNIKILDTEFTSNKQLKQSTTPVLGGGAIYFLNNLHEMIYIYNSTFISNTAASFGGCFLSDDKAKIVNFTVDNCYFEGNIAFNSGGVFELRKNIFNSSFTNSYYISNTAGGNGGAIRIRNNAVRTVIMNNIFKQNKGSMLLPNYFNGADIGVYAFVNLLIENNTMIESGYASVALLGSFYTSANGNVRNNYFYNSSAMWLFIGIVQGSSISNNIFQGNLQMITGVYIDDLVSNILFSNNSFSKSNGGVFYFKSNNYNITIINCYMGHNVITGPNLYNGITEGGAISIVSNNSYINIINSTFESNSALSGGAIYSYSLNSYLTIASCKFIGNTAAQIGGAITLAENHENFVIVDYSTYSQILQLQTDHPYTNKAGVNGTAQVVYQKLVQQSGVSQYILTFDSRTSIDGKYGTLYIYSNMNKTTILFQTVDGVTTWPGVSSPSLVIYGSEFYVELVGPSQTVILRTNKWGFLINVYPIFSNDILQSSSSSQFIENSATRGGAIYMDSFNSYSIMVGVDFISNKATLNGGGLNLYLANDGIIFQQLRFINNSASNGGGMSLESSNFGTNIKECLFLNNTAVLGSGINFGAYNGQSPLIPNSECVISGTYFIENYAEAGAGVSIDYENNVTFSNVSFIGNVATSLGAALNIDHSNVVIISSAVFTNNAVNDGIGGGGIASQVSNDITINNTLFKSNTAILSWWRLIPYRKNRTDNYLVQ